jgi:hypothetical protein
VALDLASLGEVDWRSDGDEEREPREHAGAAERESRNQSEEVYTLVSLYHGMIPHSVHVYMMNCGDRDARNVRMRGMHGCGECTDARNARMRGMHGCEESTDARNVRMRGMHGCEECTDAGNVRMMPVHRGVVKST